MSADRITVGVSITRNLGNYESLKVSADLSTDIAPSEDTEAAYLRAWKVVEAQVEAKIAEALS